MNKYIVALINDLEFIFMFHEGIIHRDMANQILQLPSVGKVEIISAGFITMRDGCPVCHGESISLNIKSRPGEDADLAREFFRIGAQ